MRRSIRCLLIGVFTLAALRHAGYWPHDTPFPRVAGAGWYGALSFALAAVVDADRSS